MDQPLSNAESQALFKAWLEAMEWDRHGGLAQAAAALGKSRRTIEYYNAGRSLLPLETRLAMTALEKGLTPWGA